MINLKKAKVLAQNYLNKEFENRVEVKVIANEVMEIEYGWLLFYDSKEALETGDFRYQLSGNYPLLVNKYTAEIIEVIHDDIDCFLEKYYNENNAKWSENRK